MNGQMKHSTVVVVVALIVAGLIGTGCNHGKRGRSGGNGRGGLGGPIATGPDGKPVDDDRPPPKIVGTDVTIEFAVDDVPVVLGARVTGGEGQKGPGVVVVPGGGDVAKDGTRKGDGVVVYAAPVDTGVVWSESLARRGAVVLTYDKRTCGPNDTAGCHKNPQKDLDDKGPVALARDVDAACALLKSQPGFDGRLILWAHGQAAQVALSSSCADEAAAIVLLSPVPRAIDAVLVDALADRQKQASEKSKSASGDEKGALSAESGRLRDLVGTTTAEFAAMKGGKFAKDALVRGATIAFWLGWIDLTTKTPELLERHKDKVVVVVGRGDTQLSGKDRDAAQKLPAKQVVVVDADHHLLKDGALDEGVVKAVADAIDVVIGVPRS